MEEQSSRVEVDDSENHTNFTDDTKPVSTQHDTNTHRDTIQSITLTNFKSYTGTHTITPFYRFTSIIGPNASGKSNLLDAFMFMLGMPFSVLRVDDPLKLISPGASSTVVTLQYGDCLLSRSLTRDTSGVSSDFQVNNNPVSHQEYLDFIRGVPALELSKHMLVTQARSLRPEVDLLETLEIFAGNSPLIPQYRAAERDYRDSTQELGVSLERRRRLLAEVRAVRQEEEGKAEFFKLSDLRDELEECLRKAEMCEKRRELESVTTLIARLEEEKQADGHDAQLDRVQTLRREAADLQKTYFERETSTCHGRDSREKEAVRREEAAVREEYDGVVELLKKLEAEIGQCTGEGVEVVSELETTFKESVAQEETALEEMVMNNYEMIARKGELGKKLKELRRKAGRLMEEEKRRKEDEGRRRGRVMNLGEEIARLEGRIYDAGDEYDAIVREEEEKNREMTGVVRDILVCKARKGDTARKAALSVTVRNLAGIFTGVHGRVTELVRPTQRRYETAVSAALGAYEAAVVVENDDVAMECVRYVKEARAGRVTFIVLDRYLSRVGGDSGNGESLGNSDNSNNVTNRTGDTLKKCVTYDSKYEGLVNYLLGSVVLCNSVSEGRTLLYSGKSQTASQVVTLDGVMMSKNGIISRKRVENAYANDEMDELLEKRGRIVADLRRVAARKEALAEVGEVKKRIEELMKEREELEKIVEVEDPKPVLAEISRVEEELVAVDAALADFTREETLLKSKIREKERELLLPALNALGVTTLSEYKRKMALSERRRELLSVLAKLSATLESKRVAAEVPDDEKESHQVPLEEIMERLEGAKERLRNEIKRYEPIAAKRRILERQLLDATLQKIKIEEDVKELERWCRGCEVDKDVTMDVIALKTQIRETDERLKVLGQLVGSNPGRGSPLQASLNEATIACEAARQRSEQLKQRFVEIKKERLLRFNECFGRVSAEISHLYRQLAGSEACRAHILFEGDPIVNGLKYFLMPPGKGFTEFKDLSGGEKVVALQAFLFSLGKCAGAPFYLFDEIDAALDRSHVENLARFIENSPEQFLVVSLKPQFYQHSDALIGVYKREGNSHILTYRLK